MSEGGKFLVEPEGEPKLLEGLKLDQGYVSPSFVTTKIKKLRVSVSTCHCLSLYICIDDKLIWIVQI